ncbi:MAG: excalibur calcium-binding domain-containing protein [Pseudohongiellaceae bacterium]
MKNLGIALAAVLFAAFSCEGAVAQSALPRTALASDGLAIAAEHRCAPYNRDAYRYSQSVERQIVSRMGGRIYGPYEGRYFASTGDTEIEHIVALSEAHDSGMCGRSAEAKRAFARDLVNLTLASSSVNRSKGGRDFAGWSPRHNRCWYAAQVVAVKRKYGLTVDSVEAAALGRVLRGCQSTAMQFTAPGAIPAPSAPSALVNTAGGDAVLLRYDTNRNGRITCAEARQHGIAPVPRSHPAYRYMRDGDGDGVVCE